MKRMMVIAVMLLGIALGAATARAQICGADVKHSTKRVKSKSPLETNPPADKAVVYVFLVRADHSQHKVSVDREWAGINKNGPGASYFVFAGEPGAHDVCSKGTIASHLMMNLEAGKTYYLQQVQRMNEIGWGDELQLSQISKEEAAALLRKAGRTIFWEKGKAEPTE
ncbi:MAG: hypothetical protein ACRD50_12885 [Candidatus Acidiferrales bacterium]